MKYFRYHSTNCFFIESKKSDNLLAIDAGWPCTLYEYQRELKKINLQFTNIKWAIVTHFHMDHAGLISMFMKNGINSFIFENQEISDIDTMENIVKKKYNNYELIDKSKLISLKSVDAKEYFINFGVEINVIKTIGHSKDSISVLFNNEAIIGDLLPINQIMDEDLNSKKSWELLKGNGVKRIYPSHAEVFDI